MPVSTTTTMTAVLVGEADEQLLARLAAVADADDAVRLARAVEAADLRGSDAELLLVALDDDAPVPAGLVASIRCMSEAPIAAIATRVDTGVLGRAAAAGIADVILVDQPPAHLAFALRRAATFAATAAAPAASPDANGSRVVTVTSAKGGVGTSTLAVNLAALAARSGRSTLLIDMDLAGGDDALAFGMSPKRTLADVAMSSGDLDVDKLRGHAIRHEGGLDVIAAPASADDAALVRPDRMVDVLRAARVGWDLVVVDTGVAVDEHLVAAYDACDELVIVTTPCAASVRAARRTLATAEALGVASAATRVVLNRTGAAAALSPSEVAATLERDIAHRIPEDRLIGQCWNHGTPLVLHRPTSAAGRALEALAADLAVLDTAAHSTRRIRFSLRRNTVAATGAVGA